MWNNSARIKHKCQLVIRLKANKYYQELIYYLSLYINVLNIKSSCLTLESWPVLDFLALNADFFNQTFD